MHFSFGSCDLLIFHLARPGLPKRFQAFLSFKINKPVEFKTRLESFVDAGGITTAQDACRIKNIILKAKIQAQKLSVPAKIQSLLGANVAFSRPVLQL